MTTDNERTCEIWADGPILCKIHNRPPSESAESRLASIGRPAPSAARADIKAKLNQAEAAQRYLDARKRGGR